jgi:hypothetical protein
MSFFFKVSGGHPNAPKEAHSELNRVVLTTSNLYKKLGYTRLVAPRSNYIYLHITNLFANDSLNLSNEGLTLHNRSSRLTNLLLARNVTARRFSCTLASTR